MYSVLFAVLVTTLVSSFLFLMFLRPPSSTLFPYTTLFRSTQDGFSRSGWLWPVDAKGEPFKATSYRAVGFYVAKYVNKKSDMALAAKGLGAKEWNNSLKTKLSLLPKKLFRIRMSRNFGMKMLTQRQLYTQRLVRRQQLRCDKQ